MKNAARHETWSTSHPPSTGPRAVVIAVAPDHVPMARPRSSAGNDALRRARLPGTRRAPAIPWHARARMSGRMPVASPHHADARANAAIPIA
jgi:hypothetical protein